MDDSNPNVNTGQRRFEGVGSYITFTKKINVNHDSDKSNVPFVVIMLHVSQSNVKI